jgi:hypothetical protein
LTDKKEDIQRAREKGSLPWSIEFKAVRAASAMMQTSTVLTGATAYNTDNIFDDTEITIIQYPKMFVLDAISSKQVAKVPAYARWKEQVTAGDGAISTVNEGATKTLVDYKFEWKSATRKKYAGRIEMTEETEIDFEQLVIEIIDMFEQQVIRAWHDGVLTDIEAWCPSYTGSGLDAQFIAPNNMNVAAALVAQARNNEYEPDVLFIRGDDYALSLIAQNTNGDQQFIPEAVAFPGLRVFVNNKLTSGTMMVGVSSVVKEQHGAFIVRRGAYGNQFIENESTIIGEVYSLLKLPTESKKGWVKGTIATVKLALNSAV